MLFYHFMLTRNWANSLTYRYCEKWKSASSLFGIKLGNPTQYDFGRKSFTPNYLSKWKSCLFPSDADYYEADGIHPRYFVTKSNWDEYYLPDLLSMARPEIIFICIGIVAIILGSIISIWTIFDPDFKDLHKPPSNTNDEILGMPMSQTMEEAESNYFKTPEEIEKENEEMKDTEEGVKNNNFKDEEL